MSIDDDLTHEHTPDWLQSQQPKTDESVVPKTRRARRTKAHMLQDQPVPYVPSFHANNIGTIVESKAVHSPIQYPKLSWYGRNYWAMQWGPVIISLVALAIAITAILR